MVDIEEVRSAVGKLSLLPVIRIAKLRVCSVVVPADHQ